MLKCDARGRVRTPREHQERMLDEFEKSGMSGVAFAAYVGVKYPTFASWVSRRRRERAGQGESGGGRSSVRWMEVVADDEVKGSGVLVVRLAGGAHLEVSDAAGAELAARLLGYLGGARAC